MNLVDAFLCFTAASYCVFALVPKRTVKGNQSKTSERIIMANCGIYIALMLICNIQALWIVGGILWAIAACLSYLGYVQWNVLWKSEKVWNLPAEVSDEAQMVMFLWDLLIALSCLVKL